MGGKANNQPVSARINEVMKSTNRSGGKLGRLVSFGMATGVLGVLLVACSPTQQAEGEAQGGSEVTAQGKIPVIKASDFEAEVLQAKTPVVVDFYADWCGPCKLLGPIVEGLATEQGDRVKFVKVNVDNAKELSQKYEIEGIPTLLFFKDGKLADRVVGLESKEKLQGHLQALTKSL
jgi:thioredoxin 1